MQSPGGTLSERIANWHNRLSEAEQKLGGYQRRVDEIAFEIYGVEGTDRQVLKKEAEAPALPLGGVVEDGGGDA